jgi:hypothetical protein
MITNTPRIQTDNKALDAGGVGEAPDSIRDVVGWRLAAGGLVGLHQAQSTESTAKNKA